MYDIHYNNHHLVGNSGGNNEDLRSDQIDFEGKLDAAPMVTHILVLMM